MPDDDYDLVWARPERAPRGPRPAHTRDDIAAAAVTIADADGLTAVSMRGVAKAIGAGTMSLYNYVRRKDDLFDLMVDRVVAEIDLAPPPSGNWRHDLHGLARRTRDVMRRHPWFARSLTLRISFGPNVLRYSEYTLSLLDQAGLDDRTMMETMPRVNVLIASQVNAEMANAEAIRASGVLAERWYEAQAAHLRSVLESGEFPLVSRVFTAGIPQADPDEWLEHSLDLLLDSIDPG
ncbi:MAG: TetR/AcrR family transcriptional regulator [Umezawaea sp.]